MNIIPGDPGELLTESDNPWKSLFQNVVSTETTNQLRTMIMNSSHRGFKQVLKSYCSISLDPLSLWLLLWLILVECKLREEGRNFVLLCLVNHDVYIREGELMEGDGTRFA